MIARAGRILGWSVAGLALVGAGVWGTLALHYSDLSPGWLRDTLAGGFGLLALVALGSVGLGWRRRTLLATFAAALVGLLLYWRTLEPSHARDWAPEVAGLPHATVAGDLVTLHDIRNFDYRTETDFTPAYYDRTFDLRKLDALDVITSYWMGPSIAHVFLSFGFAGEQVAVSVEARKERGEGGACSWSTCGRSTRSGIGPGSTTRSPTAPRPSSCTRESIRDTRRSAGRSS